MKTMIENLINGNLADAREQAKRRSFYAISVYLMDMGWSDQKAFAAAKFLKTSEGFQEYCDAK